jgi:Cys-rich protein (TIGR01571 family)
MMKDTTTPEPEIAMATLAEPVKERTVEVVAPSNLAGGYEFFVNAGNNTSYKVRVPDGGVGAGQRFNAVIISEASSGGAHNVPSGRWRDGLCDCCAFGCCHPVFCLTFWCYSCSLGQVLHRMKLNFCANPTPDGQYPATSAFKIFWGIAIGIYVLQVIIGIIIAASSDPLEYQTKYNPNTDQYEVTTTGGDGGAGRGISWLISYAMALFCFFITMRLRTYVRERYSIPGSCCEDCCCSYWCMPCTICQLHRHTADFKTYPAGCCTDTGLNPGAPDVV